MKGDKLAALRVRRKVAKGRAGNTRAPAEKAYQQALYTDWNYAVKAIERLNHELEKLTEENAALIVGFERIVARMEEMEPCE